MNKFIPGKKFAVSALAVILYALPLAATAQVPQITAPKNKYKVQDDIRLGNQAAAQVDRQFPVMNDRDATAYIERIGQRLVASIPPQFAHPEFNYRFRWVNASDINAFALPGGPMYVNRGMIEAARNEGELAGVMAHELSHVALRHATAQATKQNSFGNQARAIGLILGGAVVGGQSGAQLGQVFAAGFALKYSREYESQADALGAEIMANAGYDPHDLANVFQTIAQQERGGRAPQWLSSHPDPGNRYEKINQEAQYLRVSQDPPIKLTRDFERIQARFRSMPRARSMAEIQQNGGYDRGPVNSTGSGRYSDYVQSPSSRMTEYTPLNGLSLSVPANWRDLSSQESGLFAPEGAYGDQGITRGIMVGIYRGQNNDSLQNASQAYLNEVLRGNSYLRQQTGFGRAYVAGRQGYTTTASGRSPVTGRVEDTTVYTTQLHNGDLFYVVTVVPDDESYNYSAAFRSVLSSIRLND